MSPRVRWGAFALAVWLYGCSLFLPVAKIMRSADWLGETKGYEVLEMGLKIPELLPDAQLDAEFASYAAGWCANPVIWLIILALGSPTHPVGECGRNIRFGGLSREHHLDEIPAAFVQLAGEMDCAGEQPGRVGLPQGLGGQLRNASLLVDEVVEGQDQRGLGTDAGVDGLHRHS